MTFEEIEIGKRFFINSCRSCHYIKIPVMKNTKTPYANSNKLYNCAEENVTDGRLVFFHLDTEYSYEFYLVEE